MALKKGEASNQTSPSSKESKGSEEKSLVTSGCHSGRKTNLSVLGVLKYKHVIFKAGLHWATNQDKKDGGWLVFGSAAKAIMNTDAFRAVEQEISNADLEIERFTRAVGKLVSEGPAGYIQEMTHDELVDLERQIRLLKNLTAASEKLEAELQAAKSALDAGRGRLSPQQEEARKRITDLEAEIKPKPFEEYYRNKKQDYDRINTQANALLATLEDVKLGIDIGGDIVRQVTKLVIQSIPEIKEIKVKASSAVLASHDPLTFDITVGWMNQEHVCHVDWATGQDAHLLYREAAKKIAALDA